MAPLVLYSFSSVFILGWPYYRSSLWYTVSSVCL